MRVVHPQTLLHGLILDYSPPALIIFHTLAGTRSGGSVWEVKICPGCPPQSTCLPLDNALPSCALFIYRHCFMVLFLVLSQIALFLLQALASARSGHPFWEVVSCIGQIPCALKSFQTCWQDFVSPRFPLVLETLLAGSLLAQVSLSWYPLVHFLHHSSELPSTSFHIHHCHFF